MKQTNAGVTAAQSGMETMTAASRPVVSWDCHQTATSVSYGYMIIDAKYIPKYVSAFLIRTTNGTSRHDINNDEAILMRYAARQGK